MSCAKDPTDSKAFGEVFLAFQSSPAAIIDLPLTFSKLTLINVNGDRVTLPVNAHLQLANHESQHIASLTIPEGKYVSMEISLNTEKSMATVYDSEKKLFTPIPLLDQNHKALTGNSQLFTVHQPLSTPLSVNAQTSHFMNIGLDTQQALTLSMLNEKVLQFAPQFTTSFPEKFTLKGTFYSAEDDQFRINLGHHQVDLNIKHARVNKQSAPILLSPIHSSLPLSISAQIENGKLHFLDETAELITQPFIKGWVYKTANQHTIKGHEVSLTGEVTYKEMLLPTTELTVHEGQGEIPATTLMPGQYGYLFTAERASHFYSVPVHISGKLIEAENEQWRIEPLVIDGKNYHQFTDLPDTLRLPAMNKTEKIGDLISSLTYLSKSPNTDQILEGAVNTDSQLDVEGAVNTDSQLDVEGAVNTDSQLDVEVHADSQLDVDIHFEPSSFPLLVHHSEQDESQLFFVDAFTTERVTVTFSNTLIQQPATLDSLYFTSQSIVYVSQPVKEKLKITQYSTLDEALNVISPSLNSQSLKLNRLKAKGVTSGDRFEVAELVIILGEPLPAAGLNPVHNGEKLTVRDTADLVKEDQEALNTNKVPIGSIAEGAGGAVGGLIGLLVLRKLIVYSLNSTNHSAQPDAINSAYYEYLKNFEYAHGSTHNIHQFNVKTNDFAIIYRWNYAWIKQRLARLLPVLKGDQELVNIGNYVLRLDNGSILPYRYDDVLGEWKENTPELNWQLTYSQKANQNSAEAPSNVFYRKFRQDPASLNLGFLDEDLIIESAEDLYRITLGDGTILYTVKDDKNDLADFYSRNFINQVNNLIESTPEKDRKPVYFSFDKDHNFSTVHHYTPKKPTDPEHFKLRPRTFVEVKNAYRADLAVRHQDVAFEDWTYIPDKMVVGTLNKKLPDAYDERTLNDLYNESLGEQERKAPKELRVIVQLEPDEDVIAPGIYETFLRYPEHSIVIQMNTDGDYKIVNGIDNLDKFLDVTHDNTGYGIVYDLAGHGSTEDFSGKHYETLAEQMTHLTRSINADANALYQSKHSRALNLDRNSFKPDHINMNGCLLGKLREGNSYTGRFADSFVKKSGYSSVTFEAFDRTITSTETGDIEPGPNNIRAYHTNTAEPDAYQSYEEAFKKGHIIYDPETMEKPRASGANYERREYLDSRGQRRRVFRGPTSPKNH